MWPIYTLWQYTDGNSGPEPHATPGAGASVDRNIFAGSAAELQAAWPFTRADDAGGVGAGFAAILAAGAPVATVAAAAGKKTKKATV